MWWRRAAIYMMWPSTAAASVSDLPPSKTLCRYELTGECRDADCAGQHRRQYLCPPADMGKELERYARVTTLSDLPSHNAAEAEADEVAEAAVNGEVSAEERIDLKKHGKRLGEADHPVGKRIGSTPSSPRYKTPPATCADLGFIRGK